MYSARVFVIEVLWLPGWSQKAKLVRHLFNNTGGAAGAKPHARKHETNTPGPRTHAREPTSKTETKLPYSVRF